jgi:hypothetical protein
MDMPVQLIACGYEASGTDNRDDVSRLERLIGVRLPEDYREFILTFGGGSVDAWVPCSMPTPFGEHGMTILYDVDEVIDLLSSAVTPQNMICIGYGHGGATTCLSIAGLDRGHVFSLDTEMRFFWGEEELSRFKALDPEVREFFRMRDADDLPTRPWGYENCYHVADSFSSFIAKLHPMEEPEE